MPSEMEGTWQITDSYAHCGSGDPIDGEGGTETEVICAGESLHQSVVDLVMRRTPIR